jgi:uncharacterized protein
MEHRVIRWQDRSAERTATNERSFRAVLQALIDQDVDRLMLLHTDDATVEFPFAPAGFPSRLRGRVEIRDFERSISDQVVTCRFVDVRIRPLLEPDVLMAEYQSEVSLRSGGKYNNVYCAVVRFVDGLLYHVRKYLNPLAMEEVLDNPVGGCSR